MRRQRAEIALTSRIALRLCPPEAKKSASGDSPLVPSTASKSLAISVASISAGAGSAATGSCTVGSSAAASSARVARSIFPFGVCGSAALRRNRLGTIHGGSWARAYARTSSSDTESSAMWNATRSVSPAPSGTATTAASVTPAQDISTFPISPGSMR